jgi:hypothetical protein
MPRAGSDVQFNMPTPERWHVRLLIGLFVLYVVELVAHIWLPALYQWLAWLEFGAGFQPWQLVTRFLVQGPGVIGVLFGLFVLYFFLPTIEGVIGRRQLGYAVLSGAVVGTLLPMAMDLAGIAHGAAMGWGPLVATLPVLFGLARPDATILLLVFPVRAVYVLWGSLVVAILFILVERSLGTFQTLGVWLGVFGWWHVLGPGGRRRRLAKKADAIERELKKSSSANLRVIDGGKSKPQGRQGDDWVH